MAKEQQLPLALDGYAMFEALRIRIEEVRVLMDNLERQMGRKPAPRRKVTHVEQWSFDGGEGALSELHRKHIASKEQAEKPTTPKVLSLGARVVGNHAVGDGSVFVHVVDRGRLDVTVYGHKDRSIELTNSTYNKAGEGERITFKVHGHQMVVNVDAKFRTGSAYFQVGDMKIGVAELKECPLNPFED